ncbi:hypothetical protein [Actinomadura verrucosospora]|uniref:Uncharacterized protein n=1 Tax=Actinomadura verrucosospora TaxID=46165 RepID=A0A7D3VUA8_ACTVE|nr:hypothetical protein [Actinomadura verrucosospora]QKG22790.1 hypothetical protein ACTIVE_4431 [Actinomadura verrucosospora]
MGLILRLLVAAGLAADAVVHWRFAPQMAFVQGGSIHGDVLFRVQAGVAAVAAVIILTYAARWSYAVAFLVAGSAVGALLLYYYVDVGALGPLPDMHEPVWYTEKTISLAGEGTAAVAAVAGFCTVKRRRPDDDEFAPEREHARGF